MLKAIKPRMELTLAILKPDINRNPEKALAVKNIILTNGFYFVRSYPTILSKEDAERFYEEHRNKFFFTRLVGFMTSGTISAHILAKPNAIKAWRQLMGPTNVYKAQYEAPDSIRGKFGLTDTRNAAHGSDSPLSAHKEINFFFRDFNAEKWFNDEEPYFNDDQVEFDQDDWTHKVKIPQKYRINL